MKKQFFILLRLLFATTLFSLFLTSCTKEEVEGPGNPGTDPENPIEMETTHTIKELQEMYDGSDLFDITEEVVIGGVLSSSDSLGNVHKALFIQDESGYGIQVKLNKSGLFTGYSIGQTIYVKCQGLMMGNYGGLIQLGGEYEGKIEEDLIDDYVFAGAKADAPTATTLDLDNLPESIDPLLSTWVTISKVQFVDKDSTFTNGTFTTNRNLTTTNGGKITLRTSNYATFANEQLPTLSGTIQGVLTVYNGTLQLTINEVANISFTEDRFEIQAGNGEGTLDNPFDLEAASARLGETDVWVKGYIIGSVNGASLEEDFILGANGESSSSNIIIAATANETDPTKGMPVQLTTGFVRDGLNLKENPTLVGKEVWVKGNIENYFNAPGIKSTSSYSLDGETEPDAPSGLVGQGEDINGTQLTNTSIDFSTWNEVESLAMWEVNDMSASVNAYGKGATVSWMISKTALDFTAVNDARLILIEELKFFSNYADIQVLTSTNYTGSGDPTLATWTALEVDGNRAEGGVIETQFIGTGTAYVAFKYSATEEESMSWRIESVKVGEKEVGDIAEGDGTLANAYNVPAVVENQGDKGNNDFKWVKGKIVGYFNNSTFFPGVSDALATNLAIAIRADETSATKVIPVQLSSGYIRDALNISENPAMLNTDVWLKGSLETYFSTSGIKNLQSYSLDGVTEEEEEVTPPEEPSGDGINLGDNTVSGFSDLIISEYLEGSSNNKYIEIFNGTGLDVDLSGYSLRKDTNGNNDFSTSSELSGTLPNGATLLLANASAALDLSEGITSTVPTVVSVMYFNGDDQVGLFKADTEIDRIGISGDINFGKDVTFIRKPSVRDPKSGENDPRDNGEWDSYPKDTADDLGSHSVN